MEAKIQKNTIINMKTGLHVADKYNDNIDRVYYVGLV